MCFPGLIYSVSAISKEVFSRGLPQDTSTRTREHKNICLNGSKKKTFHCLVDGLCVILLDEMLEIKQGRAYLVHRVVQQVQTRIEKPLTPKGKQFQISPAVLPEILDKTV